jgi:hypothetical protein
MYPDQAPLPRFGRGTGLRLADALAFEHDAGTVRPGRCDLHERRLLRHDDGRRYPEQRRVIGHRLGMIAGRHSDHAMLALGRSQ